MNLHDVVSVIPITDYLVRVEFDDGSGGTVDVAALTEFKGVFAELRDPAYFRRVSVHPNSGVVCWPNGADLDSDVLYGRVTGPRLPQVDRRAAWAKSFAEMANNGDDALIWGDGSLSGFDVNEWEW